MCRSVTLAVCCVILPAVCHGDAPVSSYIFPAGAQRGSSAPCRVAGLNLSSECGFQMLGQGVEAPGKITTMPTLILVGPYHHNPIAQQAWDYPKDLAATIKIAADASLGTRYWYCTTAEGATQLRPFIVGDLPELLEDEWSTEPGRPQAVTIPVTINGRIYPRADLDEYAFDVKAAETLSCEVVSQRIGHKLDAKLQLLDPAGRLVAEADDGFGRDPMLVATIPADGRYMIRISDIAYEGDQDYVYRLTIRSGPSVLQMFPAGGKRGSSIPVRLYGAGLGPTGYVDQVVHLDSKLIATAPVAGTGGRVHDVPGATMAQLLSTTAIGQATHASSGTDQQTAGANAESPQVATGFQISDVNEFIEREPSVTDVQRVTVPCAINGQLGTLGDVDSYQFTAAKGEAIDFDFFGKRIGSPISAVWTIRDSQGKSLVQQEGDTRTVFTAPADGDYTLRIHELHRETHGGPEFIYRVIATRPLPDFRLTLERDNIGVLPGQSAKTKIQVVRTGGFSGAIQLAGHNLPVGVTVSPSEIAANQNQIELTFTAGQEAPVADTRRALVIGMAAIDGQRVLHTAEVPTPFPSGVASAIDSIAVTVAHPPLFAIDTEEVYANANRGATYLQRFTIDRKPGFDGEITLSVADRQTRYLQGATGPAIVVQAGQRTVDYPVFFPDAMDLNRTARVLLMGTAQIHDASGKALTVTSTTSKQVVVRVSPSVLTLAAESEVVEASRGTVVEIPLHIGRAPELTGPIQIELIPSYGAKGIMARAVEVAGGQVDAKLSVQLAPDAAVGVRDSIQFRARADRAGFPVVAETSVQLIVD